MGNWAEKKRWVKEGGIVEKSKAGKGGHGHQ